MPGRQAAYAPGHPGFSVELALRTGRTVGHRLWRVIVGQVHPPTLNRAANRGLQIVSSAPAQIVGGEVVSSTGGAGFTPTPGDPAFSFKPNGWLVEGYNNNASGELVVRPWVVCAEINK